MAKGRFEENYPKVIKYLKDNDIEYTEYANGQHLKILGATAYVELWPSKMTYHVIQSERPVNGRYERFYEFDEETLDEILNGA